MKIAVTGGSGRLGTLVLRRLAADRSVSGIASIDLKPPRIASKKLTHIHADVRDADLGRHFAGCDAVAHLAIVSAGAISQASNVGATMNVLQQASAAGVKRAVVIQEPLTRFEKEHPDFAVVRLRTARLVGASSDPVGRLPVRIDLPSAPVAIVWDEDVADAIMLGLKRDIRGSFDLRADGTASEAEVAAVQGQHLVRPPTALRSFVRHQAESAVLNSASAKEVLGWKPQCPTAADVLRRCHEVVPSHTDPRLRVFFKLLSIAPRGQEMPPDAARMSARMHLMLTGPGGGDFEITLKEGKINARMGIPRPPSVSVILKASTFLDMLGGRLDYSTAQLTGKIRTEGEALQGMLVQGIVTVFRQQIQEAAARPWPIRKLMSWMEGPRREEHAS